SDRCRSSEQTTPSPERYRQDVRSGSPVCRRRSPLAAGTLCRSGTAPRRQARNERRQGSFRCGASIASSRVGWAPTAIWPPAVTRRCRVGDGSMTRGAGTAQPTLVARDFPLSLIIGRGRRDRRLLFGGHGTELRGRRAVDRAIGGKRDAVVALGGLARNDAVGDIARDLVGIARRRIAEPAAPGQFEPDEIAARHGLPAL